MGSKLEAALARKVGAAKAREILKDLGPKITTNPVIERSPDMVAEAIGGISIYLGPSATAHEIASEFVRQMLSVM
jgi:hypothetical protein